MTPLCIHTRSGPSNRRKPTNEYGHSLDYVAGDACTKLLLLLCHVNYGKSNRLRFERFQYIRIGRCECRYCAPYICPEQTSLAFSQWMACKKKTPTQKSNWSECGCSGFIFAEAFFIVAEKIISNRKSAAL